MFFQFDNLIASMIAIVVVLVMLSLQRQGGDVAADATRYHSAKKDELNLVEMVKHDFQNMRADLLNGPHITMYTDSTIEFRAQVDGDGTVARIGYLRKRTGRVHDGAPVYVVERYVEGERSGGNLGNTVEFTVKLFDDIGNEISNLSQMGSVTTIGVSTSGISSFGAGDHVQRTRWSSMFRPSRLAIDS